jgi:glycosyltransferase involved in cell wall biosynthesis
MVRLVVKRKPVLAFLTSPIYNDNERVFLDEHLRAVEPFCEKVFVITNNFPFGYGDRVRVVEMRTGGRRSSRPSIMGRVLNQIMSNLELSYRLNRIRNKVDLVVFDIGEYRNLMPLILCKLLKKRTMIFHLGSNKFIEARFDYNSGFERIFPAILILILRLSYNFVDSILCTALNPQSIIESGGLQRYRDKIVIFGGPYVQTERFVMRSYPSERECLIGYAGRLTSIKGVINLVRAIPLVLVKCPGARFIIAGSGELRESIATEVRKKGLEDKVRLVPWIPHESFPAFLNQLKLFVVPSYQEGIPLALKEAMGCGAIAIATPVGAIPDLVQDGRTGFVLRNNSPACVAETIGKALANPNLDSIAVRARSLIEREFSNSASLRRWNSILNSILQQNR